MRYRHVMSALILCAGLLFFVVDSFGQEKKPQCSAPNGLTDDEIEKILDMHNDAREAVGARKLKWDCSLAQLAQDWVARAIFEHRDTFYGENIFVASNPKAEVSTALDRWMREKDDWDEEREVCRPGKVCLHYTQVTSKRTERVGCGINRNTGGKWPVFLVCNYDPSGNLGYASK